MNVVLIIIHDGISHHIIPHSTSLYKLDENIRVDNLYYTYLAIINHQLQYNHHHDHTLSFYMLEK